MAITLKKLSGDTEVVANPTLDGSETALSGLQIDGVKYSMPSGGGSGGGKHYVHCIQIEFPYALLNMNVILPTNQSLTKNNLHSEIYKTYGNANILCNGFKTINTGGVFSSIKFNSATSADIRQIYHTSTSTSEYTSSVVAFTPSEISSLTDNVIEV